MQPYSILYYVYKNGHALYCEDDEGPPHRGTVPCALLLPPLLLLCAVLHGVRENSFQRAIPPGEPLPAMCTIAAQHAAPVLLLVALVSSDSAAADAAAFSEHGASTLTPSCTVTSHGAKGDNRTEDTHAVQAALDSCATVVFSAPGKYLIRPVFFRHSGLSVVIEPGATIVAWGDIDTWNTTSPKISALFCQDPGRATDPLRNFSLTGGGVIDGQGWRWWPFLKTRSRPELLSLYRVEGALISGITFRDSPSFHVSVRGYDIEIAHSRVEANIESCLGWDHAPNTDAFNIGGGNIHLHDLWVHNGDDCIPTNPGPDGYTSNVLVENIHCECGTNGGVIIVPGSRGVPPLDWQAGGPDTHPKIVANVTYRNMSVHHTNQGAGFKISEAYENVSGMAQNVTWEDIEIYKPRNTAIYMNVFTEDASEAACKVAKDAESRGSTWLTAHDFTFKNIAATTDGFPGCLLCSPTNPCKVQQTSISIAAEHISISCVPCTFKCSLFLAVQGITFDNVTVRSTNSTAEFICFNAHGESHDSSPDPSCLKAAHGPAHEPVQQLEAARSWVMTFEDDFAGDALNASSWTVSDHDKTISQYDGHDALFIKERVMVAGGYLAITTVNEANTLDGVSYNFTSGWIDSKQKVNQSLLAAPTRWEASMKMASAEANGAWPACANAHEIFISVT